MDEGEGLPVALVPGCQHHGFLCCLLSFCCLRHGAVGDAPGDGLEMQRLPSILQ